MKKYISLLTIVILISIQISIGQKFSNLEQFQQYYIDNCETIDKIEGIWNVKPFFTPVSMNKENMDFVIAIVKEKDYNYRGYRIEEGYYRPGNFEFTFYSRNNEDYKIWAYHYNLDSKYYDDFFLINNSFETSFNLTNTARKVGFNFQSTLKWTFIKIYPSESDLLSIKRSKERINKSGTCFALLPNGLIVTNYHIIENAKTIGVKGINGDFANTKNAEVLVIDKNNDLALLQIIEANFTSISIIPFTLKAELSLVGEEIFVLGYPLKATMGDEIKLTNGIISSKTGFQGDITSYQISAPVQPGSSGSPLFDSQGNLIGIINAKHVGAENASYAIKSSYLMNLLELLPNSPQLQTSSVVNEKSLSSQVEILSNFVFIIEAR